MTTVLLVVHMIIAVAMIVMVLLQRSEGGALGIGGGGGMMSGRSLGNALTRTTAILAAIFFATSIGLTVIGTVDRNELILDGVIETEGADVPLAPAPLLPEPDLPTPPTQ